MQVANGIVTVAIKVYGTPLIQICLQYHIIRTRILMCCVLILLLKSIETNTPYSTTGSLATQSSSEWQSTGNNLMSLNSFVSSFF